MRFLLSIVVFYLFLSVLNARVFKMDNPSSGMMSWRSWDTWKSDIIESGKDFPLKNDDVIITPQNLSSNFTLFLQLPTGFENNKTIEINSFAIDVDSSVSILSRPDVTSFIIENDFIKTSYTSKNDSGNLSNGSQGNFAIGPNNMQSFLNLEIRGNVEVSDIAVDRTSNCVFGGAEYFGKFKVDRLLASFRVKGDMKISNQNVYIATENGVNAKIDGDVIFEDFSVNRKAVLIVNADDSNEAVQLLQTIKVGALKSLSNRAGLITTKTASQKIFKNNDAQNPILKSDNIIRNGNIEIVGDGGTFTGEIRDNLRDSDTRGLMNITMNSSNGIQYLLGENSYTGTTYVQSGTLIVNATRELSDIKLQGGSLLLLGENPKVKNFEFSGGILKYDFLKSKEVTVLDKLSILDSDNLSTNVFEFSNITPRKNFTLFKCQNIKSAFKDLNAKKIEIVDAETKVLYDAIFAVSDVALSVIFISK